MQKKKDAQLVFVNNEDMTPFLSSFLS